MRSARLPFLALVAVALGTATVAAASSLTTASGDFGAGGAAVVGCATPAQQAAITTTYTVSGGKVTEVILSNIPASCDAGSLSATLTNNGGSVATAGPVTVPNNGVGSVKLTVPAPQPATASVTDVRFVVVGP